jgi:hypothetical protein
MGHTIQWDNNDKTVVLQQYMEDATKDDLYELARKSAEMLSTCQHLVHLIIDERLMNLVLNSADMSYLERQVPHNQGAVVMVVRPESVRYNAIRQQMGQRIAPSAFPDQTFFSSLEEARYYLEKRFGVRYSSKVAD